MGYSQQAGPEGRLQSGRGVSLMFLFSVLLAGLPAQVVLWLTHPSGCLLLGDTTPGPQPDPTTACF